MCWLNLADNSNFSKPTIYIEIDNKVSLSVMPIHLRFSPNVHQRVRNSSIRDAERRGKTWGLWLLIVFFKCLLRWRSNYVLLDSVQSALANEPQ